MTARQFVDTNVLLYAISTAPDEAAKMVSLMTAAIGSASRFRISHWDAAILEAARSLGCRTVLSEDLAHGRDYEGVEVSNPFRRR